MNYHENLRNMKRKRMIKILDILEMKNANSKILCHELHVSKGSVLNYIRELNKIGAEIECMSHEPFNFYLIDKTIVNELKDNILGVKVNPIKLKNERESKEYIKHLLLTCKFYDIEKRDAIAFVKRHSKANLYDIYLIYDEMRKEYLKR